MELVYIEQLIYLKNISAMYILINNQLDFNFQNLNYSLSLK